MASTRIALRNISRHRSRSLLTILGIAVGIGLVLTLGAISEGLSAQIEEQFSTMAAVVNVVANDEDDGISADDIDGMGEVVGVESVVPTTTYDITRRLTGSALSGSAGRALRGSGIRPPGGFGGGFFSSLRFTGVGPEDLDYLVGEEIIAIEGRRLDETDEGELVVLLGYSTAVNQNLNLGDEIEYERTIEDTDLTESHFFEVIGILEETGQNTVDSSAYVPLSTMQDIEEDDTIGSIIVNVADVDIVETVTDDINDQFDDVTASSSLSIIRQIESTLDTLQLALIGIGAVAVLVGGIGITNTMIMSVMERRRDMGIMKAIGATRRMILMQVLKEAVLLSLIGGFSGLVIAYLGVSLMPLLTGFNGIITFALVVFGMGFALVLGMGAGIYPALKASKLDPIEVLRYE